MTDKGKGAKSSESEAENGVGTGVVVKEDGTIMTNFHVISGSTRLEVTFMDGTQSSAVVVGVRPENDLAIIKPAKIPDDLSPRAWSRAWAVSSGPARTT